MKSTKVILLLTTMNTGTVQAKDVEVAANDAAAAADAAAADAMINAAVAMVPIPGATSTMQATALQQSSMAGEIYVSKPSDNDVLCGRVSSVDLI